MEEQERIEAATLPPPLEPPTEPLR